MFEIYILYPWNTIFHVSDNGPSLASKKFNTFCKLNGIKHLTIAPYHPSSDSAAEHSVQTFKTSLKKIIEGKEVKELNTILQHCQTHTLPTELLFNRKLNTHSNFVKPTLTDTIASHKDNFYRFDYYSKNLCQFYPGDRVWIRDYRKVNTKWIEGQVVKKISDIMYVKKTKTYLSTSNIPKGLRNLEGEVLCMKIMT